MDNLIYTTVMRPGGIRRLRRLAADVPEIHGILGFAEQKRTELIKDCWFGIAVSKLAFLEHLNAVGFPEPKDIDFVLPGLHFLTL